MLRGYTTLALCMTLMLSACAAEDSKARDGGASSQPSPAEAGFLDLPALPIGAQSKGRLFYSFRSAEDPDDAPVLVFFNGGVGAATSNALMAFGTGPHTLDPTPVDELPRENPFPYTAFGNLLYLDTRQAGFSYDIAATEPACLYAGSRDLYVADAAEATYALLDFLDAHEVLRDNPIVLVGESYGGSRAALMLYFLQHYAVPSEQPIAELSDLDQLVPGLRDRIGAHFAQAFADGAETPEEVAAQFGWQILIQPNVAGFSQQSFTSSAMASDPDFEAYLQNPTGFDEFDVRRSIEDAQELYARCDRAVRDPASLELLLGVPLRDIDRLAAADRGGAFRVLDDYAESEVKDAEAALSAELGVLGAGDAYFLPLVQQCEFFIGDEGTYAAFADVTSRTKTFITNARWDSVVYTEALPSWWGLDVDMSLPKGAQRPGVIVWPEFAGGSIRFPTYESGHQVSMTAPTELGEDVLAWLSEQGALSGSSERRD